MDDDRETMATRKTREEIDREAEENRKEALLASTQSLQPKFNRPNPTQKQISKLQELHKRLMQIKASSKILKKPEASKNPPVEDSENSKKLKQSTSSPSSTLEDQNHQVTVPKKPHKLYWGFAYRLDTRERWERN